MEDSIKIVKAFLATKNTNECLFVDIEHTKNVEIGT